MSMTVVLMLQQMYLPAAAAAASSATNTSARQTSSTWTDQRHAPAGPDLDALQREERFNVTCVVQCTSSSIDSLPTLPTDND